MVGAPVRGAGAGGAWSSGPLSLILARRPMWVMMVGLVMHESVGVGPRGGVAEVVVRPCIMHGDAARGGSDVSDVILCEIT